MLELQHIRLNEKVELLCKLAMGLTDFSPHSDIYLSPFSSSWPRLACQVPNSKDNSEYAVLCSLLRGSTDFFFWLSMGRRWDVTTLNFKEVSYESGNLQNHSSDNVEPNSKDKSEYAVLCSLLRGSTVFFFWLSMGRRSSIRTLNLKKSAMEVLFCTIIVVIT